MITPEAKPDADYTTQQAADRCGMSINTLLAWERRYGVPSPRRNERDERIYTEADLRVIQWLKDETARGTPIGQAVRHLPPPDDAPTPDAPSDDVVVALDPARAAESRRNTFDPGPTHCSQAAIWQQDLTRALYEYDRARVATILGNAALASSPLRVAEQVVVPTMHSLVVQVEAGAIDRIAADLATRWLTARLSHWLDATMPPREHAGSIVVLASDSPLAAVRTLAIALRRATEGHSIIDLPANSPTEAIQSVVLRSGASEVIAFAHDPAQRRALRTRLNLLRSNLPASVTLTLLDPHTHPSLANQSSLDEAVSTHNRHKRDTAEPSTAPSDTPPHPAS